MIDLGELAALAIVVLGIVWALSQRPEVIRAKADAALVSDAYTLADVGRITVAALKRADPDLEEELAERILESVLEDLEADAFTLDPQTGHLRPRE